MTTTGHITTAEQLLRASDLGPCELLRGELIMMSPSGGEHSYIGMTIGVYLTVFVKKRGLGRVFGSDGGFQIGHDPDTVRAPDAAFVCAERAGAWPGTGFIQGPPDLAVEVISPTDRPHEVLAKVQDWLDAGCRLLWLVDPKTRTVSVHRAGCKTEVLGTADQLRGEDVVPGFILPVAEIFA